MKVMREENYVKNKNKKNTLKTFIRFACAAASILPNVSSSIVLRLSEQVSFKRRGENGVKSVTIMSTNCYTCVNFDGCSFLTLRKQVHKEDIMNVLVNAKNK